jgi:acyl-CoA thioesterase I
MFNFSFLKNHLDAFIFLSLLFLIAYLMLVFIFPFVYAFKINPTSPPTNPGLIKLGKTSKQILKIGVIGDSTAAGQGSNQFEDNFSLQYLKKSSLSDNYQIFYQNFAISGATSQDVIENQLTKLEVFKPNLVLVSIGANDVTGSVSEQKYEENIKLITDKLKSFEMENPLKFEVIWLSIPDFVTSKILLPPLNYFLSSRTKNFNQILSSQLETYHEMKLVDIYNGTRDKFAKEPKKTFSKDGYHPSSGGYTEWVRVILQEVELD